MIIIIGILAAIAIPMFLGQRDKAKESAVKGGVHNIELGIASYAVDHGDMYPADGAASTTLVDADGELRRQLAAESRGPAATWRDGTDEGDYDVHAGAGLTAFTLVGHGSGGDSGHHGSVRQGGA